LAAKDITMKNILIPVDFSVCADNAVHYAISLARIAKANLHLCHAINIPPINTMGGLTAWPQCDEEKLTTDSERYMKNYVEKISREEKLDLSDSPTIAYTIAHGTVKEVTYKLVHQHKIDLVVMGLSGAGEIKRFFIGSNSQQQIEHATVPILLIPRKANFCMIKKIAFATDFELSDINSIHNIARLFCLFEPAVLLFHINGLPSDSHRPTSPANRFLKAVEGKINYSKIYYRHVQQKNVNEGILWLADNGQTDILAMVHRHTGRLTSILHGSHTQAMAKQLALPLLVLPEEIKV
jgi:nucleotide-binding universal stress UspA family protein